MNLTIPTRWEEFTLEVTIKTDRPERIHVSLRDAATKDAYYTNRYKTVNGEVTLYIRVPVSAENAILDVYNERNPNTPYKSDSSFEVVSIQKKPLNKRLDVIDIKNPVLRSFINWCTKFCFNAGVLSSGVYTSPDGRFTFQYVPVIISDNTHTPMNTPARISKTSGRIQIAQSKFIPMTIPMRMAILLHEFSHYYDNDDINNEVEADLNALLIYLALGYPRIEAYKAFLDTFIGAPTQENSDRYNTINAFIRDFENNNMVINE